MKRIVLILVLPIVFFIMLNAVFAADYSIDKVKINGMEAGSEQIALQIGSTVQVDVVVEGLGAKKDVKAKAWIGGYEYEDIIAETELFEVRSGITYRKELSLELPRDMEVTENHTYALHVEVRDRNNYIERTFTVFLEPKRHDVNIQDVIVRPSTMTEAGKTIGVQARIENFGEKTEKNIKVEVFLPQFGASSSTYIDSLDPYEGEDTTESTSFMMLTIPSDLPTGDYQLKVKATYASGHSEVTATRNIYVKGKDADETFAEDLARESIASITLKKQLLVGQISQFKVAVANIGSAKKTYSVDIPNLSWATFDISPAKLELSPGDASEFVVRVLPSVVGVQQVTVKVKEGSSIIKEDSVGLEVVKPEEQSKTMEKLNTALKGVNGKVILLVLLGVLVLALLIAFIAGTRPKY
ncbi:MAG TPA: hypothetical protein HA362_04340 [Nanoarchaeota archaeon]|nr:hypothetical protein [Nanoarchaeota archaeon]